MYGGKIKKYAVGGSVPGIGMQDKVPALLTPGEFVVNKASSKAFGPLLSILNGSKFPGLMKDFAIKGGASRIPRFATPSYNKPQTLSTTWRKSQSQSNPVSVDNGVYNYSVNISVDGGNVDENKLATTVIRRIQELDARRIRSSQVRGAY
jgi:hypothetical protein